MSIYKSNKIIRIESITYTEEIIKNIALLYDLPEEAVQPEMLDFFKIVSMGAKKYAMNNWLLPDGKRSSEKEMHDSMFHHLAESYATAQLILKNPINSSIKEKAETLKYIADKESGLDPLLHLSCRALMKYTLRQRGIVHERDK